MKILVATPLFPPDIGGPASYSKLLADKLPAYGLDVSVVSFGSVRHLPKVIRHLAYCWKVYREARSADVVYAQDPVSVGLPALAAARMARKCLYVKIVGDYAWEQGVQRFGVSDTLDTFSARRSGYPLAVRMLKRIETLVARKADKVIVPSQYLKTIVINWGIKPGQVQVIYNAVESVSVLATKAVLRPTLALTGPVLVSVGRLVSWKGFDTLIGLMPRLGERFLGVRLLIAGSGPDEGRLKHSAQEAGVADSVVFLGQLDRTTLHQYIKAADLLVLNTGYEGFSHLLLETMLLGTPIITTAIGGNPELIQSGEDGILVAYNDEEAIVKSVSDLLADSAKRQTLADRASAKAGTFTEGRMIHELLAQLPH